MLTNFNFKSIFKEELNYFIKYKQSLGYNYNYAIPIITILDKNLLILKDKKITMEDFSKLIERNNMSNNRYKNYYRITVQFCKYLILNNYQNIFYIDKKFKENDNYIPIIFNHDELERLFETLDNYKNIATKTFYDIRYAYSIIFRLTYACGLRISETLNINIKDINFEQNTIFILNSKNHVSRLIVFSESMKLCLQEYIKYTKNTDGFLFKNRKNKKIRYNSVREYYKTILKIANLNENARIHELRHTFVNDAFNQMLEKGYDENVILVYIYRYLGHKSIKETIHYIHFTDYKRKKLISYNKEFSKKLYKAVNL